MDTALRIRYHEPFACTDRTSVTLYHLFLGWTRSMAHTGGCILDTGFSTHLSLTLPFQNKRLTLRVLVGFFPQVGQVCEFGTVQKTVVDESEKVFHARHGERRDQGDGLCSFSFFRACVCMTKKEYIFIVTKHFVEKKLIW